MKRIIKVAAMTALFMAGSACASPDFTAEPVVPQRPAQQQAQVDNLPDKLTADIVGAENGCTKSVPKGVIPGSVLWSVGEEVMYSPSDRVTGEFMKQIEDGTLQVNIIRFCR